ncbi:MAG TPA: integrase [Noviherbaspirillum sp.]|nr:integrase [Noviherbaspirillum sp.]
MSLYLLDLRPIKDFAPADKAQLPVSIALLPDGTPLMVSRYGDVIWDFYPYIRQENLNPYRKQIDWRIALPDGRRLTDPAHAALLESTKDFIWSLFADPVEGRKRPTMQTLIHKVQSLKTLLRWMVRLGITRFAELTGRTLDYVPVAKLGERSKAVAPNTVASSLSVVEDLHHQRDKLNDALSTHPWPHESAPSLAGIKMDGAHRKPKTEFIPDAVAARFAEVALDYVQKRAAGILAAREAADAAKREASDEGRAATTQSIARTAAARAAGYADAAALSDEVIRLRTACYIVIDLFSGIRDSEMMSIAEHCIAPDKSKDGSTDILWLHGTIYKTGQRPKRWLVPPVVEEAVRVLTRLTAPLRVALEREEVELQARIGNAIAKEQARLVKRLDTVRQHKDKLFLAKNLFKGAQVSVLSGMAMNADLKRFCAELGIRGEDGRPYPLHAHQFRRTYARFIARSELGDLLTLRDHFGHWSIDMTILYADGGADEYEADTELLEMVTKEKMDRQGEVMAGYLDSDAPLANGAHWLAGWRASVRTAANKEALIKEYAGTITLNGTGHSWCVGNARGTGCGGLCVFEAQMCVECNYGIIGGEHRPVWEGIREQQREALALDDMGPGGRQRAQTILEHAEKVLRRLDGREAA